MRTAVLSTQASDGVPAGGAAPPARLQAARCESRLAVRGCGRARRLLGGRSADGRRRARIAGTRGGDGGVCGGGGRRRRRRDHGRPPHTSASEIVEFADEGAQLRLHERKARSCGCARDGGGHVGQRELRRRELQCRPHAPGCERDERRRLVVVCRWRRPMQHLLLWLLLLRHLLMWRLSLRFGNRRQQRGGWDRIDSRQEGRGCRLLARWHALWVLRKSA